MAGSSSAMDTSDGLCYPTTDDFDQNTAKRLVAECSALVIEDIPIGTQFGIDLNVYNIGHKFLGIKMIASGLHFIHYSAVSAEGSVAPRTGFFKYFKGREVVVKKYNKYNEDIEDIEECNDCQHLQQIEANVRNGSLDRHLGAYQFSTYADWVGLTDYITESLFNRLNPKSGKIKSVTELIPICGKTVDRNNIEIDSEGLPVMKAEPNSVINFTEIPKRFVYPLDSNAAEISRHSMDASYTLESLISKSGQINDILGELQFAFVTFIVGHLFDSFEFWKQLLKVLCFSETALKDYNDLYLSFIRVLHFQLKQSPHELFADIVENNNFLVIFLRNLFSNIKSNPNVSETLRNRGQRFQRVLTKNFKWDFSSELEDEAPTVVDT